MITRFAPSPTGQLHLGHAYSAMLAFDMAQAAGGTFLLRIEDTDTQRSKPAWETQIEDDLHWLGLSWPSPVLRQSKHLNDYAASLAGLDLTFPCRCNRADIRAAISAPQEGVLPTGPDGVIYPGTCRHRQMSDTQPGDAIRLDMTKALARIGMPTFTETGTDHVGFHTLGPLNETAGDIVLGRRDTGAIAYHLACVIDDARQGITHVIRGADLFEATALHVLLQNLLGLPTPTYHHHKLIRDDAGKRLAKRDDARAIAKFRAEGSTPADIRQMVGLPPQVAGNVP